jgi:hypothetical protein
MCVELPLNGQWWSCTSLHSKANLLDVFTPVLSAEINLRRSGTALITNEKNNFTFHPLVILWKTITDIHTNVPRE